MEDKVRGRWRAGNSRKGDLITRLQDPIGKHTIEVCSTLFQTSGLIFAVVGFKALVRSGLGWGSRPRA